MPVTFQVDDVEKGARLYPTVEAKSAFTKLAQVNPEAWGSNAPGPVVEVRHQSLNGLVAAVHLAYDQHYPLTLSPDDVWLTIAQGFAIHVNENAEALRQQFVAHEGKKYIEVVRNSFVKGSPDNDWMGTFSEFSDKLAEHIGKKRDLLVSNFSTTGVVERAASEIVLMDAMQSYFSYGMRTACGIPEVTLLGTVEDWKQIRDRARALSEFQCEAWINALVPVLDEFVKASEGQADPAFWQEFYKLGGGSGGPFVSGWINTLFPYVGRKRVHPNKLVVTWKDRNARGGVPEDFPNGMSAVPFVWHYYGQEIPMQFLGGFVGPYQDPTDFGVRPSIGWAIADKG